MGLQFVPLTDNIPTGGVCVNKDFFFFFCFSSTNKLRNKLENCLHLLQPLGVGCALSLQGRKGPWFS